MTTEGNDKGRGPYLPLAEDKKYLPGVANSRGETGYKQAQRSLRRVGG